MNLRWIERDGKMILQERSREYVWPKYVDVPTHQEPKKVTVEEELAKAIGIKIGSDHCELEAKAAIEFFKKRMTNTFDSDSAFGDGYNEAIKDVRQALFGEA